MVAFSVYSLTWALVFATATSSVKVMKQTFPEEELPPWLVGPKGARFAFFAGSAAFFSSASLLIWGAIYTKWYVVPLGWAAGLLSSGFVQQAVAPTTLISF